MNQIELVHFSVSLRLCHIFYIYNMYWDSDYVLFANFTLNLAFKTNAGLGLLCQTPLKVKLCPCQFKKPQVQKLCFLTPKIVFHWSLFSIWKKCCVWKKSCVWKLFMVLTKFRSWNYFGSEKIWGSKKFLGTQIFWSKNQIGSENNICPKKL